MNPSKLIACMIVLCLGTSAGYALDTPPSPDPTASLMGRIADREQAALEARGVVLVAPSLSDYLQGVADRLWHRTAVDDMASPSVLVVIDSRIDAYAYPNGRCCLTTGMLDILENENQLAMILAHELVHYARRHTASFYGQFKETTHHDDRRDGGSADTTGVPAMRRAVETAERQADEEGLSILGAAGYDQTEVLTLMSTLTQQMSKRGRAAAAGQLEKRAAFFRERVAGTPDKQGVADRRDYLERIAPALIANAQSALRRGDWDQAQRSIARFMQVRPVDALAYYLNGEIMRRREGGDRFLNCVGSYRRALEIDPSFPPAHRALGELYFKAGRFQQAKPHFETFLSLAPEDTAGAFIKGYLRQCQN
ncbi:MAG TPA: M48 family metalloprotease [Desulfosarcina sp.]|nr:M48 family metalloprotease [Desulfosarcina sp.]